MEHLGQVIQLFPGRTSPRERVVTFKQLADKWLLAKGPKRVCPQNEQRHLKHLAELWDKTEAELRPWVVEAALNALLGKLGPATVNKIRSTGRRIIRDAKLNEMWEGSNPFEAVDRLKEPKKKFRRLTLEEVRAMLPHLRFDRRVQALFLLYLGPRPGEVRGLKKKDVDLRKGTILVRRSYGRDSTKTGKQRLIPIPDGFWPYMEDAVRSSKHAELVFPAPNGAMETNNKLSRTLRMALAEAGIVAGYAYICRRRGCGYREERPEKVQLHCPTCGMVLWVSAQFVATRWYDLRATSAMLHRRAGAHPMAVHVALGHAPDNVTEEFYDDMTLEDLRRELGKLEI